MGTKVLRNALFGAAMASSIGFGAVTATAKPAPAPQAKFACAFVRIYEECEACCGKNGHLVENFNAATGECTCSQQ